MTATITQFDPARQADLDWNRIRHRREHCEVFYLPPPVVIRGLQARVKAAPVSRQQYAKAAALAGMVSAHGASPAYSLMVGNSELRT